MTMIIDPSKIRKYRIEINKIEITPYRVDIGLARYKKFSQEDQVVNDKLWFTDEEGNLAPDEIAELYWILFADPEYQKVIGVYYDGQLVAFQMMQDINNPHYITWNTDGILVVNCLEGMNYQKESTKDE